MSTTVNKARSRKLLIGILLAYFFIISFSIYILLPVFRVIQLSLQPLEYYFSIERSLIPRTFTLDNFIRLFTETPYPRWLLNSVIIASLQSILTTTVCVLAAYAYTVYDFRAKERTFMLLLSTLMIPLPVGVPALFIFFRILNLINTYWAVVLPGIASVFSLFFMRSYMRVTIIRELIDSARIDGASEFKIFYQIIAPLLKPGIAALITTIFTASFNEYFWPLIVLRSEDMYTVQVGLPIWNVIIGAGQVRFDLLSAGALASTIPPLLIFIVLQKYLTMGLSLGAVKR
jgi:ABC-type glycerol-3-phosphate transport system permease component